MRDTYGLKDMIYKDVVIIGKFIFYISFIIQHFDVIRFCTEFFFVVNKTLQFDKKASVAKMWKINYLKQNRLNRWNYIL